MKLKLKFRPILGYRAANNSGSNVRQNRNLGRTFCPANFLSQHLTISFTNNIWLSVCHSFKCTLVFMSDQIFLLSDQNGALVGHTSFQGKKIIFSPGLSTPLPWASKIWEWLLQISFFSPFFFQGQVRHTNLKYMIALQTIHLQSCPFLLALLWLVLLEKAVCSQWKPAQCVSKIQLIYQWPV